MAYSDNDYAISLLQVRLTPNLEVYAQIPRPEGVREGSMPYTAWKCTTQPRNSTSGMDYLDVLEF